MVVVNNGPADVTSATLAVTLPPQTRLVSAIVKHGWERSRRTRRS
jgi:hypothetical protein